ncbi:hypothetical protein DFJ73DRAFT_765151 [Zopfochytrium polystomum]|nr:hypothetical protein DFJ73DRAFT_765151 [Zopfochytrium polystomum]
MNAVALKAFLNNLMSLPENTQDAEDATKNNKVPFPVLNTCSLGTNPIEQTFNHVQEQDRSGGCGRNDKSNAEELKSSVNAVPVAEKYVNIRNEKRGFSIGRASSGKTYIDKTARGRFEVLEQSCLLKRFKPWAGEKTNKIYLHRPMQNANPNSLELQQDEG